MRRLQQEPKLVRVSLCGTDFQEADGACISQASTLNLKVRFLAALNLLGGPGLVGSVLLV